MATTKKVKKYQKSGPPLRKPYTEYIEVETGEPSFRMEEPSYRMDKSPARNMSRAAAQNTENIIKKRYSIKKEDIYNKERLGRIQNAINKAALALERDLNYKKGGKVSRAQDGKKLKPNYSNIKGKGWDYFKTPTSKDSADYRKGFDKRVKGENLKQYNEGDNRLFPGPSGGEIKGYTEASKRLKKPKAKDGKWIQKAVNPKHKGYCTPMTKATCTPKRKALAKTFKAMGKARKGK